MSDHPRSGYQKEVSLQIVSSRLRAERDEVSFDLSQRVRFRLVWKRSKHTKVAEAATTRGLVTNEDLNRMSKALRWWQEER